MIGIIVLTKITLFSTLAFSVGFNLFEPSIECTVIKVHSVHTVFGIQKFPTKYHSINNNPQKSLLVIAGTKFPRLKPSTVIKTDNFEKILISNGNEDLYIELNGKPISRNGTLKVNGKLLADITCH